MGSGKWKRTDKYGAGLLHVTVQIWKHCNGSTNAILLFGVSISVVVLHRQLLYGFKNEFLVMTFSQPDGVREQVDGNKTYMMGGGEEVRISGHKRGTDRRIQKLHSDDYGNTHWFSSPPTLVNKSRKKRLEGTWYAQRNGHILLQILEEKYHLGNRNVERCTVLTLQCRSRCTVRKLNLTEKNNKLEYKLSHIIQ